MYNRDICDLVINIWVFAYVDNQLLTSCHVSIYHCYVDLLLLCNVTVLTMSVSCILLLRVPPQPVFDGLTWLLSQGLNKWGTVSVTQDYHTASTQDVIHQVGAVASDWGLQPSETPCGHPHSAVGSYPQEHPPYTHTCFQAL